MTKQEKRLICAICVAVLIFSVAYSVYNRSHQPKIVSYEPYYISRGETLWGIAKPISRSTGINIQNIIYEIKTHNKITANIKVGQTIEIPTYSTNK